MKYFFDTEFSERAGERPTIELISIGIVCEDSRTYYAESADFNDHLCDPWVKENVLTKLGPVDKRLHRDEIAEDIQNFIAAPHDLVRGRARPELWAYYASYDWVVFCWLFGRMIDLPAGYPMLPMDLQQWWIQLGCPDIKPPVRNFVEHNALADALWNQQLHHVLQEEQNERNRR